MEVHMHVRALREIEKETMEVYMHVCALRERQ